MSPPTFPRSAGDGCWYVFCLAVFLVLVLFIMGVGAAVQALFLAGDRTTEEFQDPTGRCVVVVREKGQIWQVDEVVAVRECEVPR